MKFSCEVILKQLKSAMPINVFSYSKTGPVPVWLDSEKLQQYLLFSFLEEIDCDRKNGAQKNAQWTPKKNVICGIEESEYAIHFWNSRLK